jgi:alpha-mannosidase
MRKHFLTCFLSAAALLVLVSISPLQCDAQQKRIYIANDDHTDFFWTEDERAYRTAFRDSIDYYISLADATQGETHDHESRWNCDGSYWMWVYDKYRSPSDYPDGKTPAYSFDRFIDRVRDGHISVPLNALVLLLGGAPAEAVLRGMYYPGQIERRYDVRFPLVSMVENQTLPYGIIALWSGSGGRYSWKGICSCDSRIPNAWDREHEIYWARGPDTSRILMKWNSMLTHNQSMGGYAEARDPAAVVDYVDTDPDFRARYPYSVIGAFGKGHDDFMTLTDEFVTVAKNKTTPSRRVVVSNEQDFFEDFESSYGEAIPHQSVSFGNEWELYIASMAEVSSRVKRAVEKLRSAEAMAAIVSLNDPAFMDGREQDRDQAWMNLGLFWEHNWGMVNPQQPDLLDDRVTWQKELAADIENYVNTLYTDAAAGLGALIPDSGNLRFFVFNPLSWERTDIADFPYSGLPDVHVIDVHTGSEVPSQVIDSDGEQHIRVVARNVPSVGYKVFEIRLGPGQSFDSPVSASGSIIENQRYRVSLSANGAVTGLYDKQSSREFVRQIEGRFVNDLGPGSGTVVVENQGPVSATLKVQSSEPLSHTTRITLFREVDRISIENRITENFGSTFDWAFGFEVNGPNVWHEEVGAVVNARLASDGGHYADRNMRYDWLTLGHFADLHDQDRGVTLSNWDCYFMQLGGSSEDTLDVDTPQLKVLAGSRNLGGTGTTGGIPNQGGDSNFLQRFALRTHTGFNSTSAMKFALAHQNPLVTGMITGGDALPESRFTFLSIDNPDVLLWAVKPAEEGVDREGIVTRVWNTGFQSTSFTLDFPSSTMRSAKKLSHIETPERTVSLSSGKLVSTIKKQQILTFSLHTDSIASGGGCFIATSAFGSPGHPHVRVLRQFRDRYLITTVPGRTVLRLYYAYSPPIARVLQEKPGLAVLTRGALLPAVCIAWAVLKVPGPVFLLVLMLVTMFVVSVVARLLLQQAGGRC